RRWRRRAALTDRPTEGRSRPTDRAARTPRRRRGETRALTRHPLPPDGPDGGGGGPRAGTDAGGRAGAGSGPSTRSDGGGAPGQSRTPPRHRGERGPRTANGERTPGPDPRPGTRAPGGDAAGGGGGGGDDGGPRHHTTPPPGAGASGGRGGRPQRAGKRRAPGSAAPGRQDGRRTGRAFGKGAERAPAQGPPGAERRAGAVEERTAGHREGLSGSLRHLGGEVGAQGARGVPPPEASSARAVRHLRTPAGPTAGPSNPAGPGAQPPPFTRPVLRERSRTRATTPSPNTPARLLLPFLGGPRALRLGRPPSHGGQGGKTPNSGEAGFGPRRAELGRAWRPATVRSGTRAGGGGGRSAGRRRRTAARAEKRGEGPVPKGAQRRREPGHRVNAHGIPPPPHEGGTRDRRGGPSEPPSVHPPVRPSVRSNPESRPGGAPGELARRTRRATAGGDSARERARRQLPAASAAHTHTHGEGFLTEGASPHPFVLPNGPHQAALGRVGSRAGAGLRQGTGTGQPERSRPVPSRTRPASPRTAHVTAQRRAPASREAGERTETGTRPVPGERAALGLASARRWPAGRRSRAPPRGPGASAQARPGRAEQRGVGPALPAEEEGRSPRTQGLRKGRRSVAASRTPVPPAPRGKKAGGGVGRVRTTPTRRAPRTARRRARRSGEEGRQNEKSAAAARGASRSKSPARTATGDSLRLTGKPLDSRGQERDNPSTAGTPDTRHGALRDRGCHGQRPGATAWSARGKRPPPPAHTALPRVPETGGRHRDPGHLESSTRAGAQAQADGSGSSERGQGPARRAVKPEPHPRPEAHISKASDDDRRLYGCPSVCLSPKHNVSAPTWQQKCSFRARINQLAGGDQPQVTTSRDRDTANCPKTCPTAPPPPPTEPQGHLVDPGTGEEGDTRSVETPRRHAAKPVISGGDFENHQSSPEAGTVRRPSPRPSGPPCLPPSPTPARARRWRATRGRGSLTGNRHRRTPNGRPPTAWHRSDARDPPPQRASEQGEKIASDARDPHVPAAGPVPSPGRDHGDNRVTRKAPEDRPSHRTDGGTHPVPRPRGGPGRSARAEEEPPAGAGRPTQAAARPPPERRRRSGDSGDGDIPRSSEVQSPASASRAEAPASRTLAPERPSSWNSARKPTPKLFLACRRRASGGDTLHKSGRQVAPDNRRERQRDRSRATRLEIIPPSACPPACLHVKRRTRPYLCGSKQASAGLRPFASTSACSFISVSSWKTGLSVVALSAL
ncbi:collagen alpha-1(I) chain-like, partial [Canis lupus dingo]|uniref:collagen alpha-1(I) chain-like n=1 Tax=Canis lupus dingo TaxID=286419 RepID=UPI0020C3A9C5